MDQDETDRVARLRSLAEQNFLRVRRGADGTFQITSGARGRVVCTGDLGAVEQWLLRYNQRIDADVRAATLSQADIELAEIAAGRPAAEPAGPPGDPARSEPPDHTDVDTAVVVHCAVITSQLSALTELLFRNPAALLGVGLDPLHLNEFTTHLRRAADALDGLLPDR